MGFTDDSCNLLRQQSAPLPLGQFTQHQLTNRYPDQAQHAEIESSEQPAYLPVAALVQDDFQPGVLFALAQQLDRMSVQRLSFDNHAGQQTCQQGRIRNAIYLHVVGLVRAGIRIGDACRPFWIVAEKQQAFAGFVEASDGRDPWQAGTIETAINRFAILFVPGRRDQTARLVEHQVDAFAFTEGHAIDRNALVATDNGKFRILHHATFH